MSHLVWLFRTRDIRRKAKEANVTWENFPEAQDWESNRWRWRWRHKDGNSSIQTETRCHEDVEIRNIENG